MILISNTFLFARIDGLNCLIATILGQATDSQINVFGHYWEQEENKYVIVFPENKPLPLAICAFGIYGHTGHKQVGLKGTDPLRGTKVSRTNVGDAAQNIWWKRNPWAFRAGSGFQHHHKQKVFPNIIFKKLPF